MSSFWDKIGEAIDKMHDPQSTADAILELFDKKMDTMKGPSSVITEESGTGFVELKTQEQRLKYLKDPNVPEENKQEVLESVKPEERKQLEKEMAPKSGLAGAEGDPMDFSLPGGTLSTFTNMDNYRMDERVAPAVAPPKSDFKPG